MDYITAQEAGEKWKITRRRVQILCSQDRIPNAKKMANLWLVPQNAEKPKDPRGKNAIKPGHKIKQPVSLPIAASADLNAKLASRAAQLELALQSSGMGAWQFNIVENKRTFDQQTCNLLGIDFGTFTGKAEEFFGVIHPDDLEKVKTALAASINDNVQYEPEYRVLLPDGRVRYLCTKGSLLMDAFGKPLFLNGVLWDGTIQKQKENALQTVSEEYVSVFENSPISIEFYDSDGYLVNVNNACIRLYGVLNREKLYGMQLLKNPNLDPGLSEKILRHESIHVEMVYDFDLVKKSNAFSTSHSGKKHLELSISPVYHNSIFSGYVVQTQDITDRKRAETTLLNSEEQYRLLYSSMNQGLALHEIICNDKGTPVDYRFISANPAYEKLTGLGWKDLVGKTVLEVLPQTEPYWIQTYGNVALTGKSVEFENYSSQLERYYGVTAYSPKRGQFATLVSDITDRRKHEEEINYLSYHDQLTGLHNRRYYEEELARMNVEANLPLTIIMWDVNGLKLINDSFGHVAGDNLLKTVSRIFQSACRTQDLVARIGGDEFVFIMPKSEETEAIKMIEKIKTEILNDHSNQLKISAAFGYETKHRINEDIQEIFQGAENHMYRHKLSENASLRSQTIDLIMETLFEKNPPEMQHSQQVGTLCEKIALMLKLDAEEVHNLKVAGLMHDIGKIGIEETIWNKPGNLNPNEWVQVKRHPEIGYRILSSTKEFSEIADCILEHHEKWDGTGYPKGLKGNEILLPSRIIAVADAFDAMTSERTYRKKKTKEEAFEELRRYAKIQFDPEIVEIFIANYTE